MGSYASHFLALSEQSYFFYKREQRETEVQSNERKGKATMVSSEHIKALYVAIPLYIVMLVASAYWAHTRMEKMTSTGTTDHISAHYLGGRSFGPLVTAGTIFASLFSGYTAIGIPNEAYNKGWTALRWMPTTAAIVMGYFGTALRLRKLSLIRNHQSPVDFITDRYQSQVLRYTMLFSQTVPAVIYVSAQVISLKSTFNSMFEIDPDSPVAVIIMMIMILLFEWAGGLSSVAMTDCIQGFIMVISFIALPSVIKSNFGGWKDFDPATFPKPDFYQTPDKDSQWDFWQFSLLNFSFFTLPHFVQRIYAARDLKSLKFGFSVITVAPWLTMFTGVFMGTVGVQILGGEARSSPFSDILEAIMDVGGFPKGVAVIAFTASLAALMSTADSLIIAISQLITAEVIYPARPNSTPKEITIAGRFVSLCTVGLALAIGLSWDEGITDLGNIQFPLSLMAVPTFIWGLFATSPQNDVHPWCLAAGDMVASIYIFFIYFLFIDKNSDPAPINAGTTGMCIHLFVTLSLEAGRRVMSTQASGLEQAVVKEGPVEESENEIALQYERPDWDVPHLRRFGEKPLSHELVWKAMVRPHPNGYTKTRIQFILFAFAFSHITTLLSKTLQLRRKVSESLLPISGMLPACSF
jgi:Na+/proline symporter